MERRDGKNHHNPRPDPVQKFEMMEEIWERKRKHQTFEQIGKAMGISATTAWSYFYEYKNHRIPPSVEQDRLMALEHLQAELERYSKIRELLVAQNDVELQLKIGEHMRRLLADYRKAQGLDAAKKYEITGRVTTPVDEELADLAAQFDVDMAESEARSDKRRANRKQRFHR
jgi:transcriptional regulator with XRE-family HTH domain